MARPLESVAAMPTDEPEDLCDRTFRFTCKTYDYAADLVEVGGLARRVAYQLFDAAGSVGANREEAKAAYSRKDFAAKNSISLRESREALFWLRVSEAKRLGNAAARSALLNEARELVAIFTRIVKRLQRDT